MGRLGQVSPDYLLSVFIFSVVVLYTIVFFLNSYYSTRWDFYRNLREIEAQRIALSLLLPGNWSSYPFYSTSLLPGNGLEINETRLRILAGMPYQHIQKNLGISDDFFIKVEKIPSISISTDLEEHVNITGTFTNITFKVETSEPCNLSAILTGKTYTTPSKGIWRTFEGSDSNIYKVNFEKVYAGNYKVMILCYNKNSYGYIEAPVYVG